MKSPPPPPPPPPPRQFFVSLAQLTGFPKEKWAFLCGGILYLVSPERVWTQHRGYHVWSFAPQWSRLEHGCAVTKTGDDSQDPDAAGSLPGTLGTGGSPSRLGRWSGIQMATHVLVGTGYRNSAFPYLHQMRVPWATNFQYSFKPWVYIIFIYDVICEYGLWVLLLQVWSK